MLMIWPLGNTASLEGHLNRMAGLRRRSIYVLWKVCMPNKKDLRSRSPRGTRGWCAAAAGTSLALRVRRTTGLLHPVLVSPSIYWSRHHELYLPLGGLNSCRPACLWQLFILPGSQSPIRRLQPSSRCGSYREEQDLKPESQAPHRSDYCSPNQAQPRRNDGLPARTGYDRDRS